MGSCGGDESELALVNPGDDTGVANRSGIVGVLTLAELDLSGINCEQVRNSGSYL